MVKRLFEWICLPRTLSLWQNVVLFCLVSMLSMSWLESSTSIAEASYCFMDAVLWVDGLVYYQHGNVLDGNIEGDRPPLSLWMGAWLYAFGYSEVQALQMVSRLSFSVLLATVTIGLLRWTSVVITGLSLMMVLGSTTFAKLILWLNAEMLVNALFVVHLCVGWYLLEIHQTSKDSPKQQRIWLTILGIIAGVTVCAKEQGILLLPWSILGVVFCTLDGHRFSEWKRWLSKVSWYLLGAVFPLGWYGVHLYAQWVYGEKWLILKADLLLIATRDSFDDQMTVDTTWGSFADRFGVHESWWGLFRSSSQALLQDMSMPIVLSLGVGICTMMLMVIGNRRERRLLNGNWTTGAWILFHIVAMTPLLLVPIFEPYHYTVLWVPSILLLAWSSHRWIETHRWKGLLVLGMVGSFASSGYPLTKTLKLEREGCISTRLIPVRTWMSHKTARRATLWVTDSLTSYDRSIYPQRAKPFSQYDGQCSYQDYVATSGLSNEFDLFAQERAQFPKAWVKVHQQGTINKEVWTIYRAVCHERGE